MKKLARVLLLIPFSAALIAGAVVWCSGLLKHREQVRIIDQVRDTLRVQSAPLEAEPPAVRGKVLVWDVEANEERGATGKELRPELQGQASDAPLTIVAITHITRREVEKYNSGECGYRQDAQVRLIYWPEKKLLGTYEIRSERPPTFVFRSRDETGPILGNLDKPLARWINALPQEGSPEHKEALARYHLIQSQRDLLANRALYPRMAIPAARNKILVVDVTKRRVSEVQKLLPAERRATLEDQTFTIVSLVEFQDEQVTVYSNNKKGFRRNVMVTLMDWPDKAPRGQFVIPGEDPPLLVFGMDERAEDGNIYGDYEKAVARWVEQLPPS